MKRMISFLLAALLVLSTAACGAPDAPTSAPTTEPTTVPTTTPTTVPTTAPTTEPTTAPTTEPTTEPTTAPTTEPTTAPTTAPTTEPTTAPTTEPTEDPGLLKLNREDFTLMKKGETWKLYSGSAPLEEVTFTSDDPSVATFVDGVVTAVGTGKTKVHAERGGVKLSCMVYCRWEEETKPTEPKDPTEPTETEPTDPTESTQKPAGKRDPVKAPPETFSGPSSFYNDAAFIGDSVSMMLRNYCADTGDLGKARFFVVGSYGVNNALSGELKVKYQGKSMFPEDALAAAGVKKVFIMLGMNDLNISGLDGTIEKWGTLVERIRDKNPGIEIYIQSMTPIYTGAERGKLNNKSIDSYNQKLKAFAAENDCHFVEIASYLKDSTNGLAEKYCSDEYVHLTKAAAAVWVKVLKDYAGY